MTKKTSCGIYIAAGVAYPNSLVVQAGDWVFWISHDGLPDRISGLSKKFLKGLTGSSVAVPTVGASVAYEVQIDGKLHHHYRILPEAAAKAKATDKKTPYSLAQPDIIIEGGYWGQLRTE